MSSTCSSIFRSAKKGHVYSLANQILRRGPLASETLQELQECYDTHGSGSSRPSLDGHMTLFERPLRNVGPSYLVVDALDECNDRATLLEKLADRQSWKLESLHFFAINWKETDIENTLNAVSSQIS